MCVCVCVAGPGEVGSGDQDLYTDDAEFGVDSEYDVFIEEVCELLIRLNNQITQ